jgi:diguanylate cyclase (GGDEF)-like protein
MSPATCIGFILAGAVFALLRRVPGTARILLVRVLCAAVAALGAVSLIGYALGLPKILDAYWLAQVSLPTAASFLLLALGLWLDLRNEPWNAWRLIRGDDNRIALTGALVVALSITATGVFVFWAAAGAMERALAANLAFGLKSRKALVTGSIERAVDQLAELASRPTVLRNFAAASGHPEAGGSLTPLPTIAGVALRSGFTAIAFFDAGGRELARAGEFLAASELRLPLLSGARRAELLWDGEFLLQSRADVVSKGARLGEVWGQHRLRELHGLMADVGELGASGEFGLCGLRPGTLHCAPTRLQPKVFDLPIVSGGKRLPMNYAMEGGTGVLELTDYRGKHVLAAYAPLEMAGAGLVLKSDLQELFAPIRELVGPLVLILLVASVAGGWALRWSVHPLARSLVHGEERVRMALEGSQMALWDWEIATGRIRFSALWSAMLGGLPGDSESSSEPLFARVHPDDAAGVQAQVRAMLGGTTSHYDIEHRVRTDAGTWKWIRSRGRVVQRARDGKPLRAIGTNVDIDERKGHELNLAHRAAHDVLTGLPNRGMFHDRLDQAFLRARRTGQLMAVMYLDVDKFKAVNDTLGHAAGDALLKEFARRLSACVRGTDTVARFGGDEFAVIVEGLAGREDGLRIAGEIVAAMRPEFLLDGQAASISTSVGIAFREANADSAPDELLKSADKALYEAKSTGRDRFCVAS